MKLPKVITLAVIGLLVGILIPTGAYAAGASSSYALAGAYAGTCGWSQAAVNNSLDRSAERTKNTTGGAGGCTSSSFALTSAQPGRIGAESYLVRNSGSVFCGHSGPIYNTNSATSIESTAYRLNNSSCPGASGAAYHGQGYGYKYEGSSGYGSVFRQSPSLNFN